MVKGVGFRGVWSRGLELGLGVSGFGFLYLRIALHSCRERDFFIDSLLVRIHSIVEMISVDWPCPMGV